MPENKILIISSAIKLGGVERASSNLANALDQLGYHTTFLTIFRQEHFFTLNPGIRFIEPGNFNINKLDLWRTLKFLREKIKEIHADAILVFSKFNGALVAMATLGSGHRYFLSERSSPHFRWERKVDFFNKIAFNLHPPVGVMSQTKYAADYQKEYYTKSRIKVIPNMVKKFPECGVERKQQLLAVGRKNDPLKGLDRLIDAYSLLKNPWPLKIVGAASDEKLNDQINRLQLSEKIQLVPPAKDMGRFYYGSGIFIIPSRSEGFPNALCEAMSCGAACISFDFRAGASDLINHEVNGLLVENGNVQALATAIERLQNDERLRRRLSQNAQKISVALAPERIAKETAEFLEV